MRKLLFFMLFCSVLAEITHAGGMDWPSVEVQAPGLERRKFESRLAGSYVAYHVLLPPSYPDSPGISYPVLYRLHGAGTGTPGVRYLAVYFRSAMSKGMMPEMLVVFPGAPHLSMWVDSMDGSTPVESVFIGEIVPHVDSNFRTVAKREGRIIEGHSMGGYGAARIGFKYNALFSAVSVIAGGPLQEKFTFSPRVSSRGRENVFQRVYGGEMEYFMAESPWLLAEKNRQALQKNTLVRIVIGEKDEMVGVNRLFHERLKELSIPHDFVILPGAGHNPVEVLQSLGDDNFKFYREALGVYSSDSRCD